MKEAADLSAECERFLWCAGRIPVPEVVAYLPGERDRLVTLALPGAGAHDRVAEPDTAVAAQALAAALRRLHDLPVDQCPFVSYTPETLLEALPPTVNRGVEIWDEDRGSMRAAGGVLDELIRSQPDTPELVVVHGDASTPNFVIFAGRSPGSSMWRISASATRGVIWPPASPACAGPETPSPMNRSGFSMPMAPHPTLRRNAGTACCTGSATRVSDQRISRPVTTAPRRVRAVGPPTAQEEHGGDHADDADGHEDDADGVEVDSFNLALQRERQNRADSEDEDAYADAHGGPPVCSNFTVSRVTLSGATGVRSNARRMAPPTVPLIPSWLTAMPVWKAEARGIAPPVPLIRRRGFAVGWERAVASRRSARCHRRSGSHSSSYSD